MDSALHDDDNDESVKDVSEDGHSCAGTVVRGVLRGDSEGAFLGQTRYQGSLLPCVSPFCLTLRLGVSSFSRVLG